MSIAICAIQRITYVLGEELTKVGSVPGEGDEAIVAERLFLPLLYRSSYTGYCTRLRVESVPYGATRIHLRTVGTERRQNNSLMCQCSSTKTLIAPHRLTSCGVTPRNKQSAWEEIALRGLFFGG